MAQKRIAIILYGADRNLWQGTGARLVIRDLSREDRRIMARQTLEHPTIDVKLEDVPFDSGQVYGLTIDAKGHRSAAQLITRNTFLRQEGERTVERRDKVFRLMILPRKTESADLATGFERLVASGSSMATLYASDDYAQLAPEQQMGFLNIETKLRETFVGHDPLLSYVKGVRAVDPDRLFLLVKPELKAIVERSADFASAQGHGAPHHHPGFPACPDSWKHTGFEFGNIQLSFSKNTEEYGEPATNCHAVDADIDLARGLGHAGEWLDNNVFRRGHKTDQRLIYALLFAQGILPAYTLEQAPGR